MKFINIKFKNKIHKILNNFMNRIHNIVMGVKKNEKFVYYMSSFYNDC